MLTKSGFISQEQKEQILSAIDIVQLISDYVVLKPAGKNFLGLCPFHQEKTPSFTVSPSYQNYKCYGCGEFGDSIRFIMGIENLSFVESVSFLAERCGVRLELANREKGSLPVKSDVDRCLEASATFFHQNLKNAAETSIIKGYLRDRDISSALVDLFQLGFVDAGWQNLNRYLSEKSIPPDVQEKAGLIKKGDRGGFYDRLRNRLIFPIRDQRKRLLGFAGRSVGDDEPKYLNPPETELYKKSSVFYGIDKALNQIRRKRRAILVEGYLDAIRLHEYDWVESIATCGTAVTRDHVLYLKKLGAEEVILLFDGDSAGIKAAERSARLFIEQDLDSKVVVLPENLDPDDYFKHYSNQDFQRLVENAAYDFEFIIARTGQEFSNKGFESRENLIKEVVSLTQNIQSTIKKDLFFAKASEILQVEKKKLQQIPVRSNNTRNDSSSYQEKNSLQMFAKEHLPEVRFLQYLMNHVQSIAIARNHVRAEDFIHEDLSDIYARFLQLNDSEFNLLTAKDFPDLFVEHSTLLMYLLHYDAEYKGPEHVRPGSEEMVKLKAENEKLTQTYSEDALKLLISRLKRNKNSYDLKRMRYCHPAQIKDAVKQIVENRKKIVTRSS